MITIFFEMPYERQLRRLYSSVMDLVFDKINTLIKKNGGVTFYEQQVTVVCFDENIIAYIFSAVRFLIGLQKILNSKKDIIKEYRVLIDISNKGISNDELFEAFNSLKKQWIPDDGFFLTEQAVNKFKKYLSYEKLNKENLYRVVDFSITTEVQTENKTCQPTSFIVVHKGDSFISVLYNFILQNPIEEELLNILTEVEKEDFLTLKAVNIFLKKHRFEKTQPRYFTDAFFRFVSIYFKLYTQKNKLPVVYSASLTDTKVNTEIEKILSIIPEAQVKELPKNIVLVSEMPEDLLQVIFLFMLASRYVFVDEIDVLLEVIGKDNSFLEDVYQWLYENELIFEKRNIFTRSAYLLDILETTIGENTKSLKRLLGNFILKKYKTGEIYPSQSIINILEYLYITVDDELILSIFLSRNSSQSIANYNLNEFASGPFFNALQNFQKAINTENTEIRAVALPAVKKAITTFQEKKLEVGEYRAMLLLGFLNLQDSRIPDAISYFSYSLEIANQMRNSDLICEAFFHIGITYFLQNDLKMALSFLDKMSDAIENNFEQEWKVKCLFMKGRIFCEIGEYKKAEELFLSATEFSKQYFPELNSICETWYARALLNLGQVVAAQKLLEANLNKNFDASIFFVESLLFNLIVNDESTKLLPENMEVAPAVENIVQTIIKKIDADKDKQNELNQKMPDCFKSGYSLAEDLIWYKLYNCPVKEKVFLAFYIYYKFKVVLSTVNKNLSSNAEAKSLLQDLSKIANEALSFKDPQAHVYLYLCYDTSSKLNGESSAETTGYLSKAFKALQYRLMYISENDIRDKFMKSNSWNSRLFTVAQKHKLV